MRGGEHESAGVEWNARTRDAPVGDHMQCRASRATGRDKRVEYVADVDIRVRRQLAVVYAYDSS